MRNAMIRFLFHFFCLTSLGAGFLWGAQNPRAAAQEPPAGAQGPRAAAPAPHAKQPVDYVSPYIGSIGHMLTATSPSVGYPYGMLRVAPTTTPGVGDRYLADSIHGFPAGPATLMAATGPTLSDATQYASTHDHDFETSTPYYYAVTLENSRIEAEFTAAAQAVYYRFTFPANPHAHLVLSMRSGGELEVVGPSAVVGASSDRGGLRQYFYAEFSKPLAGYSTWQRGTLSNAPKQSGNDIGLITDSATARDEKIEVRAGVSYLSTDQARKNLAREIPAWGFEQAKAKGRAVWNQALGKMAVKGGTEKQRTIFYTALYRSMGRMNDITEDGSYFGYDRQVHSAEGRNFYVNDGLWDTYRSLHPLQLLLDAPRQVDMVRSYIRMYEQSGWLPSFPSTNGDRAVMIGHHAAALIVDTYMKGYRDFDAEKAYAGMKKNAMEATLLPWRRGPLCELDRVYLEKGFFPALAKGESETFKEVNSGERRQAVSVTLENAYDDWCVAQMAKALNKDEDYAYFMKRAHNYENVWDPRISFMAPRSADGSWVKDFDPKLGGGQGGR